MADLDLNALMQQAQQLQQQVQSMQASLGDKTVEGSAGAGMVKATVSGDQRVLKIEIDDEVMGEDREMLQDLIVAALNNALEASRGLAAQQLGSLLPPGGLPGGIPGIPGLGGSGT